MKKKLVAIGIILAAIGILSIAALSIWIGFPSPKGFDREPICMFGYFFAILLTVGGLALVAEFIGGDD